MSRRFASIRNLRSPNHLLDPPMSVVAKYEFALDLIAREKYIWSVL